MLENARLNAIILLGEFIMKNKLTFRQGMIDSIPTCIGYLSVSLAFGVLAVQKGMPLWAPPLLSLTCLSGTGQFAAIDLLYAVASYLEIACAILIINARYFLMSVSLSQKIPSEIKWWQRLIIAFGNTDENFAIAMSKKEPLNFPYLSGLILCAFLGWFSGTVIGAFAGNIVPAALTSAFGISLYAMFLAIIIPPSKESKAVLFTVGISALLSILIYYLPAFDFISSGWSIIICGIAASLFAAFLFPVKEDEENE